MIKEKILLVSDGTTGTETLVQTTSAKKALAFVMEDRFTARVATAEDVTRLVNAGQKVLKVVPKAAPEVPETPETGGPDAAPVAGEAPVDPATLTVA